MKFSILILFSSKILITMHKKNLILTVLILQLLICRNAYSQIIPKMFRPPAVIEIDEKGNIINAPNIFRQHKTVIFKITASKKFAGNNYSKFKSLIGETDSLFKTDDYPEVLNWFFSNGVSDKAVKEVSLLNTLLNLTNATAQDSASIVSSIYTPSLTEIRKLKDFPIKVVIYKNDKIVKTLNFTKTGITDSVYTTRPFKLKDIQSKSGVIRFEVVENLSFNKLLNRYFKDALQVFESNNEGNIQKEVSVLLGQKDLMDKLSSKFLKDSYRKLNGFLACTQALDSLKKTESLIPASINTSLDKIRTLSESNRAWLLKWLWFNTGQIKINPFNFTDADQLASYIKTNILPKPSPFYAPYKKAMDNSLNYLTTTHIRTLNPDTVLLLKEKNEAAEKKLIDSSGITKLKASNAKQLASVENVEKLLNKGEIICFRPSAKNYLRLHDARQKYQLKSDDHLKEFPDDYNIYLSVNNIPNTYQTKIKSSFVKFDDKAEFSNQVNAGLTIANAQQANLATIATSKAADILNAMSNSISINKRTDTLKGCEAGFRTKQEDLKLLFLKFYTISDSRFAVPASINNKADTSSYVFTSNTVAARSSDESFTHNYSITQIMLADTTKKQTSTTFSYNVAKLRTIQIAAGIAYSSKREQQVIADTAKGQFSTTAKEAKAAFVLGFKVYPFKSFLRDNGIIPRWPLHRISFFGGFEVTHPLSNLYLGLGYDIVPGLNINTGFNFYKYSYYKISNNKIIETSSAFKTAGGYVSLTLDPEVAVNLFKLILK